MWNAATLPKAIPVSPTSLCNVTHLKIWGSVISLVCCDKCMVTSLQFSTCTLKNLFLKLFYYKVNYVIMCNLLTLDIKMSLTFKKK